MGLIVDGVDLAALGVDVERHTFPRFIGERSSLVAVSGVAGLVRVGGAIEAAPVTADAVVLAESAAGVDAVLGSVARLVDGFRAVSDSDLPDREWHGTLQGTSTATQLAREAAALRLEWLCPDPWAVATAETVLPGTDVALELGDAPSPLRIDVQARPGAAAVTRIEVQVLAGALVLRSFVWTGSLAAGALWSLDDESYDVTVDGLASLVYTPESVHPYADPAEGADRVLILITGGPANAVVRLRRRLRR